MSEESAEPELPRAVALAWGIAANPQRGPKRELSIERIVEVAMQLADAGGLASVSMAAVASELGFTPMSLYRYVSAKDDLVLLMQESGMGVPPESVLEAEGWRDGLRTLEQEQLAAYVEHPWLLDIPIPSLPITPNNLAWFDAALHVLAATGLTTEECTAIVLAVGAQARWEGTVRRGHADAEGENREAREAELLTTLVTPEAFPEVAAALRDGAFAAGTGGGTFAFGLERLLDGVESYLAGRSPVAPPAADPLDDRLEKEAARDPRYKEAVKARREAEKKVREARKKERELLKAAKEKLTR
jgi:AcrR family transcriptional regulator